MSKMHYTKQEQRLLAVLSDGRPHRKSELGAVLFTAEYITDPEMKDTTSSEALALRNAVSRLRAKLRVEGKTVVAEFGSVLGTTYRIVAFSQAVDVDME